MVSFFPVTFHGTSFNLSYFTEAARWCLNFTASSGQEMANQCFALLFGAVCTSKEEKVEQSEPSVKDVAGIKK